MSYPNYIPELADDSFSWEILGIREVCFPDNEPTKPSLQFFCISADSPPTRCRRRVKVFNQGPGALKYLKPGTLWKNGVLLLSKRQKFCEAVAIEPSKVRLVQCRKAYSTQEAIRLITRADDPHFAFLKLTNYLIYRGYRITLRIPCSEIIRHYFCPTQRHATRILTGQLNKYNCIENPTGSGPIERASVSERKVFQLIRSSPSALIAAKHPFKMLKISFIRRMANRNDNAILLSAVLPMSDHIVIAVSVSAGARDNMVAVQLHKFTASGEEWSRRIALRRERKLLKQEAAKIKAHAPEFSV